ncbi:MAG: aminoacyl-tRNA hydrolase [Deltaproteobacteria bacterium]|nr:aminoacyl-tRNA hydrolase [Deltaproteobacteria bacterium]
MTKLIVGLGNPGRAYAANRHNIGFICLRHFARALAIKFDRKKGLARIGTGAVAGSKVVLARPQTYMNNSGQSVSRLVRKFAVNPKDLLVIHDDLDLPLAKIRVSSGSGSGGHKGISSIIQELGTREFTRIRVGIGRPANPNPTEDDIIAYVLSDFTPQEKQAINQIIPRVTEAILCLLAEGLEPAMNKYNQGI